MLQLGDLSYLEGKRVLITGGTGSLGKKLTRIILNGCKSTVLAIYSRDEFKQYQFNASLTPEERKRLRFAARDVQLVGPVELPWIPVGGGQQGEYLTADRKLMSRNLGVFQHTSTGQLHRTVVA